MNDEVVTKHGVYENRASFEVYVEIDENLLKSEFVFEKGEFYGVWVDEELFDGLETNTLDAWIDEYGDECWASLQDFKSGNTLSLALLGEEAGELSKEDLAL